MPTATVPSDALTSLIAASLRLVNSSILSLPVEDLRIVLRDLQHTNAITRHAVLRSICSSPEVGSESRTISTYAFDRDAREIADLSVFLEQLSTDGEPLQRFPVPFLIQYRYQQYDGPG